MAKTKQNKQKGKAKAVQPAEAPVGLREVIDVHLEQAIERGGYVPAMVKDVPEGAGIKARGLVAHWRLHGSQAVWRMSCLIEMEKKKNLMQPLSLDTTTYMGQVVARCAAPLRLRAYFLAEWCG